MDQGDIEQSHVSTEYDLSIGQRGLWFMDRLAPGNPMYTVTSLFEISGRLDVAAFRASFADLVTRHEALRTRFEVRDQKPVQVVDPSPSITVPVDDLRHLPDNDRRGAAEEIGRSDAQVAFDLAATPSVRIRLARIADELYVAILSSPHILVDRVARDVIYHDLRVAYRSRARGSSPMWEPSLQYHEFASWQRERMSGPVGERLLAYWRRALDGAPGLLELPTGRVRPPEQTFAGGIHQLGVPEDAVRAMRALGMQHQASLFMCYLTVVAMLLRRYTGRTDFCIGTPAANRVRREHLSVVGQSTNMIVLRLDLTGDPSFRQLLDRVRDVCLGGYTHQEIPFDRLVDTIVSRRSAAYNPLFQIVCSLAEEPAEDSPERRVDGVTFGPSLVVPTGYAQFDLELYAVTRGDQLNITVDYATWALERAMAERLAGHLLTMWQEAVLRPEEPLSHLELRTPAERNAVVASAPAPRDGWSLGQVLSKHAESAPEELALCDDRTDISYCELTACVQKLAQRLRERGAAARRCVAVCLPRSAALAIAMLAASDAGCAAVILPPDAPADQLPGVITLSVAPGADRLSVADPDRYTIAVPAPVSRATQLPIGLFSDLAGSAAATATAVGMLGLTARDHVAVLAAYPAAFFSEVVVGLSAGAHCTILDPGLAGEVGALHAALATQQVTVAWLPRRTVTALYSHGPCPLRVVMTDPEFTSVNGVPTVRVHGTRGLGLWAVSPVDEHAACIPAVLPLSGIDVQILDSYSQLMPRGIVGSLHLPPVRGARPEATGLAALVRDDGLIELHGTLAASDAASASVWRGALERSLLRYPVVAEAYVTTVPGSDQLIAFVVPVPGLPLDEHRLLASLAAELPQHVIPAALVQVAELPLGGDGQVDDGELPWPQVADLCARRAYLPPRDALERLVTATWAELFDRSQVSVEENFFDLGGHSLLAVQLLGRLGEIFGVRLPVSTLFAAATPAGLAMALAEQLGGQDAAVRLAADLEEILRLPEDEVLRASD